MMISSDALHLGPLMLPWTLIIVATGLMLLSAVLFGLARKYSWSKQLLGQSQDLLWSSFLLGMLGARLVFVLLNAELYFAAPIDILKIQDKGFHLWGGADWCFVVCHSKQTVADPIQSHLVDHLCTLDRAWTRVQIQSKN